MATHLSSDALSSTPTMKKSMFSSSGSSSGRASMSNVPANLTPQVNQGIGYSPGPISGPHTHTNSPAGSGIPSFRTLRSLLPFGSSKNTPTSSTASPSTSRSPFANFGSVRRSMNKERERNTSLSNEATPVISIEPTSPTPNDLAVRRSASLSRLEKPLPRQPHFNDVSIDSYSGEALSISDLRFSRRTPSPSPLSAAELSTIIEADTSGVSKHVPFFGGEPDSKDTHPSLKPSGQSTLGRDATKNMRRKDSTGDVDNSVLELPTDHLADQVREAMAKSTSSTQSTGRWLAGEKEPVVIDADENAGDVSFTLDALNPDSSTPKYSDSRPENNSPYPSSPKYPSSPPSASKLPRARMASSLLPRLRSSQSPPTPSSPVFFIPTPSPTKTSPNSANATPTGTPMTARTRAIAVNGDDYMLRSPPRSPSSPGISSTSTSTPARRMFVPSHSNNAIASSAPAPKTNRMLSGFMRSESKSPTNSSGLVSRTLRQVILGNNKSNDGSGVDSFSNLSPSSVTPTRGSLDSRRPPPSNGMLRNEIGLGRPSLELRRGNSFDSRSRQYQRDEPSNATRSTASPDHGKYGHAYDVTATDVDSSPEAAAVFDHDARYRPSFDSARPSFEASSRPGSVARVRERERDRDRQRTPSLRVTDAAGERVLPPRDAFVSARQRKRSMSVQDRLPKTRLAAEVAATIITRPGSSASVHGARGSRRADAEGGAIHAHERPTTSAAGSGPRLEWLGPRTAKAFKAAGLLDFEREHEQERERSADYANGMARLRSGSVGHMRSPSPSGLSGPTSNSNGLLSQNRSAAMRSASEFIPSHGRSHSRMAFSEIGSSSGPGTQGRRGSGTFSAYGGSSNFHGGNVAHNHAGLMESPTFTISSSSRERDTPKSSTSTAPTSLSESFGYHERERVGRDRDRDEIRELKEKHTTEMGALLGALSDSQRTVRMLREENSQLRGRLDQAASMGRENDRLREMCEMLEREVLALRDDCADLQHDLASSRSLRPPGGLTPSWSQSSASSGGFRTPVAKPGNSSPLAVDTTPQFMKENGGGEEEVYNNTIIIHDDVDGEPNFGHSTYGNPNADTTSATARSLKRRPSNNSSIFPVPPANMTMLLDDDGDHETEDVDRTDYSHMLYSFSSQSTSKPIATPQPRSHSGTPPVSYQSLITSGHRKNKSITSATSTSPTTANFSMSTGSPQSLFLRPEHEILLGDMESLDLGANDVDVDSVPATFDRMVSRDGW